jgi:hypothetical protein
MPEEPSTSTLDLLRRRLTPPGGPEPEIRETHTAWVLLTADRAYKLKKPVRFDFVDLSTVELRRRACEEEARVNRALAPAIVIGVRAVVPAQDGASCELVVPPDAGPDAIDWIVLMHRFDEADTMASRLEAGTLRTEDVERVAARIARFHEEAAPALPGPGDPRPSEAERELFLRNLDELEPVAAPVAGAERLAAARAAAEALVARHAAELDARGDAGRIRDGHGDLRAEHVVLDGPGGEEVTIIDRLEFDPLLRRVDVGDDLAFLAMDLEALGARWAASELVAAYRRAGGDPGSDTLVALFAAYRAQVRAKVTLLRGAQLADDAARAAGEARAVALLDLADRCLWRARGPLLLLVTGPPASGKSTLAAALSRRSGLPVLSSDLVRKEQLGLEPGEPAPGEAYTASGRAAVYAELARRATAHPGGAIVDATFGDPDARGAFFEALGPGAEPYVVECLPPAEVLVERARARARGAAAHGSDVAGAALAERLAAAYEPLAEVPAARRLTLDTTAAEPGVLADRAGAWLDGLRTAENYGSPPRRSPDGAHPRRT